MPDLEDLFRSRLNQNRFFDRCCLSIFIKTSPRRVSPPLSHHPPGRSDTFYLGRMSVSEISKRVRRWDISDGRSVTNHMSLPLRRRRYGEQEKDATGSDNTSECFHEEFSLTGYVFYQATEALSRRGSLERASGPYNRETVDWKYHQIDSKRPGYFPF